MATYKELKAQMEALAEQTEAARVAEFQAVVDEIRDRGMLEASPFDM